MNPATLLLIATGVVLVGAGVTRMLAPDRKRMMSPRYVVAVGDSLTAHGGYCETLRQFLPLGSQVTCVGWEGEGAEAIAKKISANLFQGADDVIVLAGVNDLASGRGVQATVEGLERIYQKARLTGARVIAVELTPWATHKRGMMLQPETQQVNQWMSMSPSVEMVVDTSALGTGGALNPELGGKDGLHLNPTGQAALGLLIYDQVYGTP